jgi:hypothetical protein
MTDEATDRAEPCSEPFELSDEDVETIVEALRYLQSTLGREEADQIVRIQAILAKLGVAPAVGDAHPRT